jgi:alkylation response protein AidB-like acyl-CoA dehydrogenase
LLAIDWKDVKSIQQNILKRRSEMPYITTEEQEKFRQTIRKLAEEKVAPRSAEIDRTGEFPWDIFEVFKANKLFGLHMPKECGGVDKDMVTCCIFSEEMSRVDPSCSNIVGSSWLAAEPILIAGSPEQKIKHLTSLAKGEGMFAFGLTECKQTGRRSIGVKAC